MAIVPFRTLSALGAHHPLASWVNFPTVERESSQRWRPALDIQENETEFVLTMDAPGLQREDFEITLEDGVIQIKGSREIRNESGDQEGLYSRLERISGSFERHVKLPLSAQIEDISASAADGVLTLRVGKPDEEQPKRIIVQ